MPGIHRPPPGYQERHCCDQDTTARRPECTETERFRAFSYDQLVARDKASLDIFRLRDESLEDTGNLPAPGLIAAEIVEDLQAALDQFAAIAVSLGAADATSA